MRNEDVTNNYIILYYIIELSVICQYQLIILTIIVTTIKERKKEWKREIERMTSKNVIKMYKIKQITIKEY